jgi:hypothetical protein
VLQPSHTIAVLMCCGDFLLCCFYRGVLHCSIINFTSLAALIRNLSACPASACERCSMIIRKCNENKSSILGIRCGAAECVFLVFTDSAADVEWCRFVSGTHRWLLLRLTRIPTISRVANWLRKFTILLTGAAASGCKICCVELPYLFWSQD